MADSISTRAAQLYRDVKADKISHDALIEEILVMVKRPLFSLIYRVGGYRLSNEDREDLFSETICRFHESRIDFSNTPLMPWLRTVARHLVIDRLRQLGRREESEFDEMNPGHGLSVHPALNRKWLLSNSVETVINDLPEDRQIVFDLCFREGLTSKEAAERLGTTPEMIQRHRSEIKTALLNDRRLHSSLKEGTEP